MKPTNARMHAVPPAAAPMPALAPGDNPGEDVEADVSGAETFDEPMLGESLLGSLVVARAFGMGVVSEEVYDCVTMLELKSGKCAVPIVVATGVALGAN